MSTEAKLTVSALVSNPDVENEILLVQEALDEGLYNLPGGALKQRERLLDAVVRETLEESGLEVHPRYLVGVYHSPRTRAGNNLTRLVVACSVTGGGLSISEQHPDVGFFPMEEIKKMRKNNQLQNTGLWPSIKDYQKGRVFGLDVITEIKRHKK
jgi:ADP-ribose pyrophosphatase YjhB (NUDIX family)